ncbi:Uncharacterised protein [Listeria grayi]|uniref:Uncharacterized protein n=1 Tax=Listeria grayi TaxID=1641 RepID=A0A378MBQ8_LISGR|nr:Uncharacterised protein [Listeria grayi]
MSKELEIEFRNMITAEEYQELIESFGLKEADFSNRRIIILTHLHLPSKNCTLRFASALAIIIMN